MALDTSDYQQIIQKFIQQGFLINPESLKLLSMNKISPQKLLNFVSQVTPQPIVIDDSIIDLFLGKTPKKDDSSKKLSLQSENQTEDFPDSSPTIEKNMGQDPAPVYEEIPLLPGERPTSQINILLQIPRHSDSTGQISDFMRY
ncbi:MAG: hypothetical protein ACFFBD_28105, partial [Candidatus Hodarchaeota archaeon]